MGCDIHVCCEYRPRESVRSGNGWIEKKLDWHTMDVFQKNLKGEYELLPLYTDRCYSLFANLAGVRRYNDELLIDDPRGLPSDICEDTRKEYESWGRDAHTCSWFTLWELCDWYNKYGKIKYRGYLTAHDAARVKQDDWYQPDCIYGSNKDDATLILTEWVHTNYPVKEFIDKIKQRADDFYFLFLSSYKSPSEATVEKMKDIRVIFWFDN